MLTLLVDLGDHEHVGRARIGCVSRRRHAIACGEHHDIALGHDAVGLGDLDCVMERRHERRLLLREEGIAAPVEARTPDGNLTGRCRPEGLAGLEGRDETCGASGVGGAQDALGAHVLSCGDRGIEGMIRAAGYARRKNIPYFGICLGMQIAVIEYARNVLGYADANSGEFDENSQHKVIDFMPDQYGDIPKGGTMRLGAYPCSIKPGSVLEKIYGTGSISERHRHRYEVNNDFREELTDAGMQIVGTSPDGRLVESVALPENSFYVGVQYHPEFKSRPNRAHPVFREFVRAAGKKEK